MDFVNQRVFANTSFRAQQRDIVRAALSGASVFVLMPTGGGKSLCYQVSLLVLARCCMSDGVMCHAGPRTCLDPAAMTCANATKVNIYHITQSVVQSMQASVLYDCCSMM